MERGCGERCGVAAASFHDPPVASFHDPPAASISAHSLNVIGLERSHDKLQEAESWKEATASFLTH